jgi:hypothetical protein
VEKELVEREASILAKEKEFERLNSQVEAFPKQLDKAVKDTEKTVMERLEVKYKHQEELTIKGMEGERKLYKQTIEALEAKINAQNDLIQQSTQKANIAGQQVQDIAIKAIESASTQRVYPMNYERKADETPKSGT